MQIQVNTDSNIQSSDTLIASVTSEVEGSLERFDEWLTHVSVYLRDENSDKKGGDDEMRCMMEARIEGRQPIAVTHQAASLDQAVDGAADKLTRLIESTLGRLRDQKRRRTDPTSGEPTVPEES